MPQQVSGYEMRLGARASMEYVNNVFRTDVNPQDDFRFNLTPSLGLSNERSRLSWDFSYRPRYTEYIEFDQRDGWNQEFRLNGSYDISARTRVSVFESFRLTQQLEGAGGATGGATDPDVIDGTQDNFLTKRNRVGANLSHAFTSRLTSSANFLYNLRRFDRDNRADIDTLSGSGSLSYRLTSRASLGLGASYAYNSFSDRNPLDFINTAQRTQSINGFLQGSFSLTPTSSLSFSAGPAYIIQRVSEDEVRRFPEGVALIPNPDGPGVIPDPDFDPDEPTFVDLTECRALPGGTTFTPPCGNVNDTHVLVLDDDNPPPPAGFDSAEEMAAETFIPEASKAGNGETITWFASASLNKNWRNVSGSLIYRRTESPSSGLGTTSIVDSLVGRLTWNPGRKWNLAARVGWNQRSSATEQTTSATFLLQNSGATGTNILDVSDNPVAEVVGELFTTSESALDVQQFNVDLSATRRLTQRLRLNVGFRFDAQRRGDEVRGRTAREFNDYRVRVGLRYTFDPLYF